MMPPVLYLGAHHSNWLWDESKGFGGFRLFVSHNRLRDRKTRFPEAIVRGWALDSMGFTVLQRHGQWTVSPREYVEATARYDREIGRMEWAAPQDRMCEKPIIYGGTYGREKFAGTRQFIDPDGKLAYPQLVAIHQQLTVGNAAELIRLWPQYSDAECPYMPALQGEVGNPESYLRCAQMYEEAGIHLADFPVVGVGSVCRIQAEPVIGRLARGLAELNLPLHWFGLKTTGLPEVWPHIASHDSQAWSYDARNSPRMAGCTHVNVRGPRKGRPSNCANCPRYAKWSGERLAALGASLAARGHHYVQDELLAGAA